LLAENSMTIRWPCVLLVLLCLLALATSASAAGGWIRGTPEPCRKGLTVPKSLLLPAEQVIE